MCSAKRCLEPRCHKAPPPVWKPPPSGGDSPLRLIRQQSSGRQEAAASQFGQKMSRSTEDETQLKKILSEEIKSQWWSYFSTPELHLSFSGLNPAELNCRLRQALRKTTRGVSAAPDALT